MESPSCAGMGTHRRSSFVDGLERVDVTVR